MKIKFSDFLSLVKVVRMIYGVEVARKLFEKNVDSYGLSLKELQALVKFDKVPLSHIKDNK